MRKAVLIAMLALLACCAQLVKEDAPAASKPVSYEKNRQERQDDAWRDVENEELVSEIEKSDASKWFVNRSEGIILSDRNRLDTYWRLNYSSICCFSRISIFSDGIVFLDGTERGMSKPHRQRLAAFCQKVVNK